MRRLLTAILVTVLAFPALGTVPAAAATRPMPGSFTGFAFDTCDAPSQRKMNAWHQASKFSGIGIYIAGANRACKTQRHLTREWVRTQARKGWRLLPLVVGRQASCSPKGRYVGKRISPKAEDQYAKARRQGRNTADSGVKAARRLGIGRGSVLWFDLEHFDIHKKRCRASALWFTSAWTRQLHRHGYRSGLYSSASSGITVVDRARRGSSSKTLPDYLWVAEWNGRPTLRSAYISTAGWWPHRRVHQYRGDHVERHGGARIHIDSNYLSTGRGTVAGQRARTCGVRVGFPRYETLHRGDRGPKVRAAHCLLRQQRHYRGQMSARFTARSAMAVKRFQRQHPRLAASGVLTKRTWTALLSQGRTPVTKYGSGGERVRRLQRALNAAAGARLEVDGVFARVEMRAVKHYQRRVGLPRTGVAADPTWRALQRGRTVRPMRSSSPLDVPALLGHVDTIPFSSGVADH